MTNTPTLSGSYHAQEGTPEWIEIWDCLARELRARGLGVGVDFEQRSQSGEVWQYLGSRIGPDGRASHSFRHRDHPKTGARESFDAPALDAEGGSKAE